MALERLQKVLARAGIGSRRACEDLIVAGRVAVDGVTVTKLGTQVDPARQRVSFDGEPVRLERRLTLVVNKPRGVVSTNAPDEARPRVVDLVPYAAQRLYTVGRLDADSDGLLLLTNDGRLAEVLAHPRYEVPKTYVAEVAGDLTPEALAQMRAGVHLAEGPTGPAEVRVLKRSPRGARLEVTVRRGLNRQVRRLVARAGLKVTRLTRVAIGEIRLGGLEPGRARQLTMPEERYLGDLLEAADDRRPPREKGVKGEKGVLAASRRRARRPRGGRSGRAGGKTGKRTERP
jgi:23S rRNA pseudouridine2605 synthase